MANKWTKQLRAYDDAVDYSYDSFAEENCLYTPSPYFNWIFANKSHGFPRNSSILFFSEMKAGKSLAIYAIILEMQRRDKALVKAGKLKEEERRHAIVFNTELRGQLQHDILLFSFPICRLTKIQLKSLIVSKLTLNLWFKTDFLLAS